MPTPQTDIDEPTAVVIVNILYELLNSITWLDAENILRIPNIIGAGMDLPVPRAHIYLDKRIIAGSGKGGALGQRSHNEMMVKIDVVHKLDEPTAVRRSIHTWEQLIENTLLDNFQIGPAHALAGLLPPDFTFQDMKIEDIDYSPGRDELDRLVDELQFTVRVRYDRKRS